MKWVLTAMSNDRPGIVEDIASIITKHQGNWVKSAMTRLGGQFAGIVQYTVEADHAEALAQELKGLDGKGITISLEMDDQAEKPERQPGGEMAMIELTGLDHPGIVRDITGLLAGKNVTIEDLETGIFPASMAGEPMFFAKARVRLPQGLTLDELSAAAEAIAQDIMVDIKLEIEEGEN